MDEREDVMFEYCLIVYLTMEEPKYIGNFINCAYANDYVAEYYHDAPYTVCLHQDYIVLPSNFIRKEVHYGSSSK
jgi:hypothetical protein